MIAKPQKEPKEKVSRARKSSKVPTRVYSYRALAPITNRDLVESQIVLASQYRNKLVEVDQRKWERYRGIWIADPRVAPALLHHQDACGGVDAAYDDLRAAKSGVAEPDLTVQLEQLDAAKELREETGKELHAAKERAKKLDREAELADPLVGPARRQYEEAKTPKGASDAEKKRLKELRKQLGKAWRAARCEAEEAGRLPVDPFRIVNDAAAEESHDAQRAFAARGLRHGAYARVEEGIKQASSTTKGPLSFERYDGSGWVGTQLTETGSKTRAIADPDAITRATADPDAAAIGMTLPELISGLDTRLRLGAPGEADKHPRAEVAGKKWSEVAALPRNVRRHAARTYVDLRVASNGRAPIFARFPVTLHRLPPKDSVIKWAYVARRRIGHHYEWRFQLTIESPKFDRPPIAIGTGACAVNLGWRRLFDQAGEVTGLRAAYVVDELGKEREIRVPDYSRDRRRGIDKRTGLQRPAPRRLDPATKLPDPARKIPVLAAIGKCDDLASIRDKTLEQAQFTLSQWLSDRGGVPESWKAPEPARPDGSVPKTMAERLHGYSAWRAAWKLHRFVDLWSKRRIDGDDAIFASLRAWAKQDRHLESWQAHQREAIIARRREAWRVVAAELARKYATIVVGKSKLTDIDGWEKKAPEDGDPSEGREQRRMMRLCAPGELRAEIEKAAAKTGARVVYHDEKLATQECYYCGHDAPWDAAPRIEHSCAGPECGRTWDQDANYCRNLLKRSGFTITSDEVPPTGARPIAAKMPPKSRGAAGSAAVAQMGPERP